MIFIETFDVFCCQSFLELTLTYHHQFVKQKNLLQIQRKNSVM